MIITCFLGVFELEDTSGAKILNKVWHCCLQMHATSVARRNSGYVQDLPYSKEWHAYNPPKMLSILMYTKCTCTF